MALLFLCLTLWLRHMSTICRNKEENLLLLFDTEMIGNKVLF